MKAIEKKLLLFAISLIVLLGVGNMCIPTHSYTISGNAQSVEEFESGLVTIEPTEAISETVTATPEPEIEMYEDSNNYLYPFNTLSVDCREEVYKSGFRYYQIPEKYSKAGGCLPEVVQVYLWDKCEDKGLDYYIVLALIERESKYKWDASGDSGNSKGYMQIYEKWHKERMRAEAVEDLYNPYGNIRVGLNFLDELYEKYGNSGNHCVLMVYNMGVQGANNLWRDGVFSTEYSREILQRAQEIKQELQD